MTRSPIIYTSSWLRQSKKTAIVSEQLCWALDSLGVEHRELLHTNDYWCRDYMPVQFLPDKYAAYLYNPDYLQNKPQYITAQSDACRGLDVNIATDMRCTFDGGNFVRCGSKVLITDKILMENAGYRLPDILEHLQLSLAGEIVILPWDMREPCGHADGMVADMGDGRILLNNYGQMAHNRQERAFHKRLRTILDAHFDVVELSYDCPPDADSWCYLNFLRVPGAILLPCLSKQADCPNDRAAIATFTRLFPDEQIVPIYALPLIRQGGALHCVTWEYYPSLHC